MNFSIGEIRAVGIRKKRVGQAEFNRTFRLQAFESNAGQPRMIGSKSFSCDFFRRPVNRRFVDPSRFASSAKIRVFGSDSPRGGTTGSAHCK